MIYVFLYIFNKSCPNSGAQVMDGFFIVDQIIYNKYINFSMILDGA